MAGKDDGWIDASHRPPTHGHKVLALQQKENDGYTPEAGYNGKPCAWVIARWDPERDRWRIVDASGRPQLVISWWRELPNPPDGVLIVPPDTV
jgi:hypothetical protein